MPIQVAGLMSRISLVVSIIPQNRLFIHVDGFKQRPVETIFKDCESLTHGSSWKEFNCHIHNRFFNHLYKLYILQMDGTSHRFKKYHGQHHQGHHFQVVDQMYWYIFQTRWRVRELYLHLLSVQSNFCGPKAFKWRGLIQEDLVSPT